MRFKKKSQIYLNVYNAIFSAHNYKMADMYPKIKAKKRKESGKCEIYVVKHTRKKKKTPLVYVLR